MENKGKLILTPSWPGALLCFRLLMTFLTSLPLTGWILVLKLVFRNCCTPRLNMAPFFTVCSYTFTLIWLKKYICDCWNISIKFLYVYLCLSSRDLFVFFCKSFLFLFLFLCYPYIFFSHVIYLHLIWDKSYFILSSFLYM